MANGNGGPTPPRPGGPGAKPPMKKSTKNWMIIGAVGAAGIVIWYVMRARSQANTSQTTADQSGIDPNTGIPYAEEYSQGYGVSGYGGGVPSYYGYYDPTTGTYVGGTGSVVTQPSTNASWAQQVEAYLGQIGYDPTTVAAALGKYLTGQALSNDQQGIVAAALGFYGNPPQGAPPIVPTGTGGGGSSGWQSFKSLKGPENMTLSQFAKAHGWSAATLKAVEQMDRLKGSSKLKKGQTIVRPVR